MRRFSSNHHRWSDYHLQKCSTPPDNVELSSILSGDIWNFPNFTIAFSPNSYDRGGPGSSNNTAPSACTFCPVANHCTRMNIFKSYQLPFSFSLEPFSLRDKYLILNEKSIPYSHISSSKLIKPVTGIKTKPVWKKKNQTVWKDELNKLSGRVSEIGCHAYNL